MGVRVGRVWYGGSGSLLSQDPGSTGKKKTIKLLALLATFVLSGKQLPPFFNPSTMIVKINDNIFLDFTPKMIHEM